MTGYGQPLDSKKHWFAACNDWRGDGCFPELAVYAFATKAERNDWVNGRDAGSYNAKSLRRRDAARILGLTKHTRFVWGEGNQVILALRPGEMKKPWREFYDAANAAAKLGSIKTDKKANASRENGRKHVAKEK